MKPARLLQLVRDRMRKDGGTYYDDSEPPELEMLDETRFLAHRYVYNFAQSGSDWADHYMLRGTIVGETVELEPFYVHLTELESDDYDRGEILALVRSHDLDGARAAIARMNGLTEAKVQAHRAAHPAPAPESPVSRCPECKSTDAGVADVIFENVKMRCNSCGFEQLIDSSDRYSWT